MSKLFTGSICLSDLNAAAKAGDKAFTRGKNGKIYCNIALWINDDADQYGNNGSLQLRRAKDDTAEKVYVGNVKEFKTANEPVQTVKAELVEDDDDQLPF